jgi:dynein regulatory complex protein 1
MPSYMDEGPSVNSSDREERINARRARIQARIDAMNTDTEDPKVVERKRRERERREFVKGKSQIMESNHRLDRIKTAGIEHVTSVRVQSDDRENKRRIAEEERRQERRHKLLTEAENSAKRNAAIAMKWNAVIAKEIPQDLLAEMNQQKEACDRVIAAKDRLKNEFQNELKAKDEEYVKALKKQAEDIDQLLRRMSIQFIELRKAYEDELEEISTTFEHEREELRDANREEMEALSRKRQQMEATFMEKRQQRADDHAQQLEQLKTQDSEDLNILKITLQTEVQSLQQQLEEMKATYLLNTEKLEYNYRVLTTRDDENTNLLQQHKKRQAKLKETLSTLEARYRKDDARFRSENKELTDDYKRITEQYKELQNKFRHFQSADKKKYTDVWEMNQELVQELASKVLQADEIIHQQQLGWEWHPPTEGTLTGTLQLDDEPVEEEEEIAEVDQAKERKALISEVTKDESDNMKKMLELVCQEGAFLVEDRLRQEMDQYKPEEQRLLQVDSIFHALSISNSEDVERLYSFLKAGVDQETGQDVLVHPNDTMARLKRFVEEQGTLGRTAKTAKAAGGAAKAEAEERARTEAMAYWEQMKGIVPEKIIRVYKALLKAMQKYNEELQGRRDLIGDTGNLQQQNMELKALLHQYLNSQVNQELYIPPTQVMRFG